MPTDESNCAALYLIQQLQYPFPAHGHWAATPVRGGFLAVRRTALNGKTASVSIWQQSRWDIIHPPFSIDRYIAQNSRHPHAARTGASATRDGAIGRLGRPPTDSCGRQPTDGATLAAPHSQSCAHAQCMAHGDWRAWARILNARSILQKICAPCILGHGILHAMDRRCFCFIHTSALSIKSARMLSLTLSL